jgi:hypothetical protein
MGQSQHGAFGVTYSAVPQKIVPGAKYRVSFHYIKEQSLQVVEMKHLFFVFAGTLMGWNAEKHEEDARVYAVNFRGFPNWMVRIDNWASLPRMNQTVHKDRATPPKEDLERLWWIFYKTHLIRMGAIGASYYILKANLRYCRPSIDRYIKHTCVKLTWQRI